MLRISLFNKFNAEKTFSFENSEKVTVGRSPENTIIIEKDELTVSKKQLEIINEEGQFILKNVGTNPVGLNGVVIEDEATLENNSTILLGDSKIIFEFDAENPHSDDEDSTIIIPIEKLKFEEDKNEEALFLKVLKDDNFIESCSISEGIELKIGRVSSNDIILKDPEISRQLLIISSKRWRCLCLLCRQNAR